MSIKGKKYHLELFLDLNIFRRAPMQLGSDWRGGSCVLGALSSCYLVFPKRMYYLHLYLASLLL